MNRRVIKTIGWFVLITAMVVGLSIIFNQFWGGKPEQLPENKKLIIRDNMTLLQFSEENKLPRSLLKDIFDLKSRKDLDNQLKRYGTPDQITAKVGAKRALAVEHASKNWIKIPVKFALWFVFLASVFMIMRKRKLSLALRNWLLVLAVIIFGVVMGSDPSPMGTVKDAIHLYGHARAIYLPRMIAMGIFLLIVVLANKYICAWGCQVGTLQDLIFHINQTKNHKTIIGKKIKPPFLLTNTIRVISFLGFTYVAFSWGFDIIEPIDPFKIYKPAYLGIFGAIFILILLISSLFIYRPWCHLFCPFGLVGWILEKVSLVKISVNYNTCIACQKCTNACPSTVMKAILMQHKKVIPDCFSCYNCREMCPTNSIHFSTQKRVQPPANFFKNSPKPT